MSSSIDYVKLFFSTSTFSESAPEKDSNKLMDKWHGHIKPAFGALIGSINEKIADIRSCKGAAVDLSLLQTIEKNAEFLHDQLCKIDCYAESGFNMNYFCSDLVFNFPSYGSFDGEAVCKKIYHLKTMLDNFEKKHDLSKPLIEFGIEKSAEKKGKENSGNGMEIKKVVRSEIIKIHKITAQQFSEMKKSCTIKNFRVTVKGLKGGRWPLLKHLN